MGHAWVDSHCHLADPRFDATRDEIIREARSRGIAAMIQGGVSPADWESQLALRSRYGDGVAVCFGMHPWWIAERIEAECDEAFSRLRGLMLEAVALGELGLDYGKRFPESTRPLQERFFRKQAALACELSIPAVLHIVRAHSEALRILREVRPNGWRGIVHAFSEAPEIARHYVDLGFHLSVGAAACRAHAAEQSGAHPGLARTVRELPLSAFVLESDSPDQPTPGFQNQLNQPLAIFEVAESIAAIRGISAEAVLNACSETARSVFGLRP